MKKLFLILLIGFSVNAQTILSENFNNYRKSTALHLYNLDSTSAIVTNDYGTGNLNLTENGDVVFVSGSALKSGGYRSSGYSASDFFETLARSDISGDFTVSVWFVRDNVTNPNANMRLVSSDNASSERNYFLSYHNATQSFLFTIFISNTIKTVTFNVTGSTFWNTYFDGNMHNVTAVHDGSTIEIYVDGVKSSNSTAAVGVVDKDDETITIGAVFTGAVGAEPFLGEIDEVSFEGSALTAQQIKESVYLMPGWLSKNGNVLRNLDTPEFYQTFYDTIGVPLSNATLGNNQVWQLSYKGKSSDATKTIKAWIGSAATAKSSVYTVTAGTAFATNTVNFGDGFALSSDTLWFASASTADTVSVDDVVLSKARSSTANGGFKGWLGY